MSQNLSSAAVVICTLRVNVLAQGDNAVTPVRLEPTAPQSRVKHVNIVYPFDINNRLLWVVKGSVLLRHFQFMSIHNKCFCLGSESDCRSRDCEFDPGLIPYLEFES